jgi:two-component system, cell cycle response regulator
MKILIADDDLTSREMLLTLVSKWGYEVVVCQDGDEAWEKLQAADAPGLALLDWSMPGLNGVEICRRVLAQFKRGKGYQYLILLTARGGRDSIVEGLDAGADDYIRKPFDSEELRVRIRAGARIVTLHNELASAHAALREQSLRDQLTGIFNRGAILDRLEDEIKASRSNKRPLTVAMADLDHFKMINDTYGHQVGDKVIFQCAQRMEAIMQNKACLGRYGGEEFLIIVPDFRVGQENDFFERLRAEFSDKEITVSAISLHATVSLGVASIDFDKDVPSPGMNARSTSDALISAADKALYQAKKNGRNRVEYA